MFCDTFNRINHLHLKVSDRTNIILCSMITLVLIAYSGSGIIFFINPTTNPTPYIITYTIDVIVGIIVLVRYRDRPQVAIGLYMFVMGLESLLISMMFLSEGYYTEILIPIILTLMMLFSGIRWLTGEIVSRFPAMISSLFLMYHTTVGVIRVLTDFDFLFSDMAYFLSCLGSMLSVVLYVLLIITLICNDTKKDLEIRNGLPRWVKRDA